MVTDPSGDMVKRKKKKTSWWQGFLCTHHACACPPGSGLDPSNHTTLLIYTDYILHIPLSLGLCFPKSFRCPRNQVKSKKNLS